MNSTQRLSELLLKNSSHEAALIYYGNNRRYFTQFSSSEGALLVTSTEAYLLMDFRYAEAASKKAKNCKVLEFNSMASCLEKLLKVNGIKSVYLEQQHLTVSQANRFKSICRAVDASVILNDSLDNAIRDIRIKKTPDEIIKIEASQAITDAAFSHILSYIQPGLTEKEIALELEFFMRKNGADSIAFELIVAAGKNSSMCHAVPSDYKVCNGDFITMDIGALLDGYHSDMTRTVAVGGITAKQQAVYDTVLKAHMAVIDAVKPGIPCSAIDKVARDIIEVNYPGRFGHALGHGVGVEIHEEPRFAMSDSTPCAPGMVVTDEPGIYLPNEFGVRIEDMLLITEESCKSLTKSSKELICL